MLVYIIGADKGDFSPENGTSGTHFQDNSEGYPSTGTFEVNAINGDYVSKCEIEFAVKPDVLVTDANNGLFDKTNIQWDVSRDKRTKSWSKFEQWGIEDNDSASWESDDAQHDDEDNDPWDGNGHLYGNDSPRWGALGTGWVDKKNMREWVRVGLGGQSGPGGTRCSEYYKWHVFRSFKRNGDWEEDDTYGNEITVQNGNVFWGTVPIEGVNITTATLPNGTLGQAYSEALSSTGGATPITWGLDDGSLPPGSTLSGTGTISGTPTTAGTFTFDVEAEDSSDAADADIQALSITIEEG